MFEFQEIIDTSSLGIKRLNDQLRQLWNKAKNVTSKDIRDDAIDLTKIKYLSDYIIHGITYGLDIDKPKLR